MNLTDSLPVIYTAQSKHNFFCRDVICEYVLRNESVPLNPFRLFDYFLGDRVERNKIRRGNNNLVRIADEVWVFGDVSDGMLFEIEYATALRTPVRYFTLGTYVHEIKEIGIDDVGFEAAVRRTDPDGGSLRGTLIASASRPMVPTDKE